MSDIGADRASCQLDEWLAFLGRAWMAEVVFALGRERLHFAALRRAVAGPVSVRMLAVRLRELRAAGLVRREPSTTGRRQVDYSLTEFGGALDAALRRLEQLLPPRPPG